MKKNILSEEQQKQRIQELIGRLDNNDFDTIKKHSGYKYVGDIDIDIDKPEIDYDDRDVEPDFFGSDDVEGGFDSYYDEPEENEYIADFSDDMTMGQDLEYGDKGFDREEDDSEEEVVDSFGDEKNHEYNIENYKETGDLYERLISHGIRINNLHPEVFEFLRKVGGLTRMRGNRHEPEVKFTTNLEYPTFIRKIEQFKKNKGIKNIK